MHTDSFCSCTTEVERTIIILSGHAGEKMGALLGGGGRGEVHIGRSFGRYSQVFFFSGFGKCFEIT